MDLIPYEERNLTPPKRLLPDNLVKVPTEVYQVMADAINPHVPLSIRQHTLMKILKEWAADKYPGFVITDMMEFKIDEAQAVTAKTGYLIEWGLYIRISEGIYDDITHALTIQNLLDET